MPVDKQVLLRYQVLNRCFRNRYKEYTIDALVDECNKALRKADKPDVSKRTIQNDINTLDTVPENDSEDIVLRINKPRFEYIRTKPFHLSQRIVEENDNFAVVTINVKVNKELEALILSYGCDMEVLSPIGFRARIAEKIK